MKNDKKKILWQTHEPIMSGANIAMLEYIDALAKDFNFYIILTHKGNLEQSLKQRTIRYSIIHQYGWTTIYRWWQIDKIIKLITRSVFAFWQTQQVIKKEKPQLICTNTLIPFITSIVAWYQKIPHIWWIHEFGKEDFSFKTGWGFEKISIKWIEYSSKLIIGNSKAVTEKYTKLMPNTTLTTIYQPVSWPTIGIKTAVKKARFLMFGQLIASKGHKDVLQAMLINKQQGKPLCNLHIKGPCESESYLAELHEFIFKNNLQKYIQIETGYFKKEEVIPLYEVLIVASQFEAFGRVIIEANKAGLYAIVRNNGGAKELINETNGLLFNNINELAAILCGERIFSDKTICLNYDEATQIQKLTDILTTL